MQVTKERKAAAMVLAVLGLSVAIVLGLSNRKSFVSTAQGDQEELSLPVANYSDRKNIPPEERTKRLKRNKRYDRQSGEAIREVSYPVERIWSAHWASGLAALPSSQSDVILIGSVRDAKAYLSDDDTGIYSEFSIQVEEVLKGNAANQVSIERFGGAVLFPSGVIQKYRASGQGMPKVGRQYVFFLKRTDDDDYYSLITGYELRGQKTIPLDGSSHRGNGPLVFDRFKGADVVEFLADVRDAIIQNSLK